MQSALCCHPCLRCLHRAVEGILQVLGVRAFSSLSLPLEAQDPEVLPGFSLLVPIERPLGGSKIKFDVFFLQTPPSADVCWRRRRPPFPPGVPTCGGDDDVPPSPPPGADVW